MNSQFIRRHALPFSSVILMALAVGIAITWNGISYWHDGAWYILYARSIHEGYGLSAPISTAQSPELRSWIIQWPPLYPVWLALLPDTLTWARISGILLLTTTCALTYGISLRLLNGRRWASVIAVFIVLTIPSMIVDGYALIWSETLFAPMGLGALLLMMHYKRGVESQTMRPALVAAAVISLSALVRYLGIAFSGLFFIYSVIWGLSVRQPRRWHPAIAFALSIVPMGLYALYLRAMTGSFAGNQATSNPLSLSDIPNTLRIILLKLLHGFDFPLQQLLGLRTNWIAFLIALLLALPVVVQLWRRRTAVRAAFTYEYGLTAAYLVGFLIMFWAMSVRSDNIEAHLRYFVPIYPVIVPLILFFVVNASVPRPVIAVILALYAISGASTIYTASQGLKFTSPEWRNDPVLRDLPSLVPPGSLVAAQNPYYPAAALPGHFVRSFGGDAAFTDYTCDFPLYPPGTEYVSFLSLETPMMHERPVEEIEALMRAWAEPCGTVELIKGSPLAILMVVRLNDTAPPTPQSGSSPGSTG